jgi:hypothetical protein
MREHIPDATKVELVKALKTVEARARHWRRCLLVELEGVGRYDPLAVRTARDRYAEAAASADAILSDAVPPAGLFMEDR